MDEQQLRDSLQALHPASFGWALACCRDQELAEDVLQSVYVKLLGRHADFDGRSSFRTWLFTVIRNTARDRLRRRWWSRVLRLEWQTLAELSGRTYIADSTKNEDDEVILIRSALNKLPTRQRQIAHLVFYEDLSIAEAADVMEVTVGTARRHYARAKESLKASLQFMRTRADESTIR